MKDGNGHLMTKTDKVLKILEDMYKIYMMNLEFQKNKIMA